MLRRIATLVALAAAIAPAAGRASEWEEDYTNEDGWTEESPPPAAAVTTDGDDYPVSVDVETPPATIETFDGALAPYGDWVVAGAYGRVWRPHVAAGWRPYLYGRWEWTSEGWLWVSDEPFGWAAYHYGRWALDARDGWLWVPGYEWAPAWVSWRYSGDVVGWAPLAPGVSVYLAASPFVDAWWTFVPCRSFVGEPVHRFAFERGFTRRYFFETTPAPPRPGARGAPGRPIAGPAWGGPPPRAIEQRIGRTITPVRVVSAPRPGATRLGQGEVFLYRPGSRPGGRPGPMAHPGRGFDEPLGRRAGFQGSQPRPPPSAPWRGDDRSGFGRGWKGGAQPPAAPSGARPHREAIETAPRSWGSGEHRGGPGFAPPPARETPSGRSTPGEAPRATFGGGRREAPREARSHEGEPRLRRR